MQQFAEVFDATTVRLTGRAQRSYARLAGLVETSDLELHTAIRGDAAQLSTGPSPNARTNTAKASTCPRIPA